MAGRRPFAGAAVGDVGFGVVHGWILGCVALELVFRLLGGGVGFRLGAADYKSALRKGRFV